VTGQRRRPALARATTERLCSRDPHGQAVAKS